MPRIEVSENATASEQHEQHAESDHNPTLFSGTFTPNFAFSPMRAAMTSQNLSNVQHEASTGMLGHHLGPPSGGSASADSGNLEPEKDPFLSLLEQLAGNDGSNLTEHGELDFFLGGNV